MVALLQVVGALLDHPAWRVMVEQQHGAHPAADELLAGGV